MQFGSYLAYIATILVFTCHDKSFGSEGFFRKLQKRAAGETTQRKGDRRLIEGDILDDESNVYRLSAPGDPDTWVRRRIPFILDSSLDGTINRTIHTAMRQITKLTSACIRFDDKKDFDVDFINITGLDDGCYGSVGRRGGPQFLNLGRNCNSVGIVLHELLHALGFWHEQSRSDRDSFVEVFLGNVSIGEQGNFNKRSKEPVEDYIMYDYDSILHYRYDQFSRNGLDTIVPTNTRVDKGRLGQRVQLSDLDVRRIKWLYKCNVRHCQDILGFMNGVVTINSIAVGGKAKYRCNTPFRLIGAETRTCKSDGTWSGAVPYCAAYRIYPYVYYNMDTEAGLSQTSSVKWRRNRGQTPSEDTGPHVDHTVEDSTGWYYYMEATHIPVNAKATVVTTPIRYGYSGGACLMFWYYMYGEGMGTLKVYVSNVYNTVKRLVWSSDSNGVLQEKKWQIATVMRLPVRWYNYKVTFEVIRGNKDTSDIAIDDVIVGHCHVASSYQSAINGNASRQQYSSMSTAYGSSGLKKG